MHPPVEDGVIVAACSWLGLGFLCDLLRSKLGCGPGEGSQLIRCPVVEDAHDLLIIVNIELMSSTLIGAWQFAF